MDTHGYVRTLSPLDFEQAARTVRSSGGRAGMAVSAPAAFFAASSPHWAGATDNIRDIFGSLDYVDNRPIPAFEIQAGARFYLDRERMREPPLGVVLSQDKLAFKWTQLGT